MSMWGSKDVEDRAQEILDRRAARTPIATVMIDYVSRLKNINKRLASDDLDEDEHAILTKRKKALERIIAGEKLS